MPDSIKQQIVARILANLEPLKSAPHSVRVLARKKSLFAQEDIFPAVHVVIGAEQPVEDAEDNRGYTLGFPVGIKILIKNNRDTVDPAEDLEAVVQTLIEGDPQLNQLADAILYDGNEHFLNEAKKEDGGILVKYWVQYRRYRADPYRTY